MLSPRFSAFMAMSLDGYIARDDGSLDWLYQFNDGGDDYGYADFMAKIDVLVMGRRSYEKVLTFHPWPYAGKRVIVLSHASGGDANDGWQLAPELESEVEFFQGSLAELMHKLQQEKVQHVYVDGGKTVCSFIREGRLDDLTIAVLPIALGAGIPMFTEVVANFQLLGVQSYDNGLVQMRYEVSKSTKK